MTGTNVQRFETLQPEQRFKPFRRGDGITDRQFFKRFQRGQIRQAGVGDRRPGQIEQLQARNHGKPRKIVVADLGAFQVDGFEPRQRRQVCARSKLATTIGAATTHNTISVTNRGR